MLRIDPRPLCLCIADGNSTESANACFSQLSPEQLNSVKAIAMDMSAAFVKAAKESIPLAEEKIVHDRFHIMQMANQSVDQIRRAENKELLANGALAHDWWTPAATPKLKQEEARCQPTKRSLAGRSTGSSSRVPSSL